MASSAMGAALLERRIVENPKFRPEDPGRSRSKRSTPIRDRAEQVGHLFDLSRARLEPNSHRRTHSVTTDARVSSFPMAIPSASICAARSPRGRCWSARAHPPALRLATCAANRSPASVATIRVSIVASTRCTRNSMRLRSSAAFSPMGPNRSGQPWQRRAY